MSEKICRKVIEVSCWDAIRRDTAKAGAMAEKLMKESLYAAYDGYISAMCYRYGIYRSNQYLWDECQSVSFRAYWYSICRCAVKNYKNIRAYVKKMIRIYICCEIIVYRCENNYVHWDEKRERMCSRNWSEDWEDIYLFEQDYIMRLIKEMVRTILKLIFNIDTESPSAELLEESEQRETLDILLDMIDDGRINEADNMIYEITEDNNKVNLEVALLFYSYLNDKSDDFLEENHFSRDEVKQGLMDIISKYGLSSVAEMFLQ